MLSIYKQTKVTKVKPAIKYLQQRSPGSGPALFHPRFVLFFSFKSPCHTKHVHLSPYGEPRTPCGGHHGTLGPFKAPDHLSNLGQNGSSNESAVSFVALGQMSFSPEAFQSSYKSLTSDRKQTVKAVQSTKSSRLGKVGKNIYSMTRFIYQVRE